MFPIYLKGHNILSSHCSDRGTSSSVHCTVVLEDLPGFLFYVGEVWKMFEIFAMPGHRPAVASVAAVAAVAGRHDPPSAPGTAQTPSHCGSYLFCLALI